ncbi:hypothetical protein BDV95DRAFT_496506 [Massariosphaeria phaeospora]|uniref:Uncharacterized protein n=1 Tax=Massariosphaeria phaeospora TaxID=100035 RepID=A0A7C8MIU7_9PLEO|nr:hypothetical protein BDV95DRAFT_496506 [Massariosphaeria phaeospora]
MRSFQQVLVLLFAFLTFALADEAAQYDATVYLTSTVYRVNTVSLSSSPTASVANETSTISGTVVATIAPVVVPTAVAPSYYPSGNGTSSVHPTGSSASPSPTGTEDFKGAAPHMNVNAVLAVFAAGLTYLAI